MKEINETITTLEPWNIDVSYVQKTPQAGTITVAASSEEGARNTVTQMFQDTHELKIIQVYRVADCPQIKDILAEKTASYDSVSKKDMN